MAIAIKGSGHNWCLKKRLEKRKLEIVGNHIQINRLLKLLNYVD